jgi:hypothetical protein
MCHQTYLPLLLFTPSFLPSSNCSYRNDNASREFIECLGRGRSSARSTSLSYTSRLIRALIFAPLNADRGSAVCCPRDPVKVQFQTQQPIRLHGEAGSPKIHIAARIA